MTADNIRSMIRKLSAIDSAVAEFIYSKDVQYYLDVLKDTTGRYIYREPSADRPAALWSRGVFEERESSSRICIRNWQGLCCSW